MIMNAELKAYLRIEATVSAAFNFFISGMVAALIYHKADFVPMNTASVASDLLITCLLTFTITVYFSRSSLHRTKTAGILDTGNRILLLLNRLLRHPLAFGFFMGWSVAAILFLPSALFLSVFKPEAVPFVYYIVMKTIFCTLLGGCATLIELYAGMCRPGTAEAGF